MIPDPTPDALTVAELEATPRFLLAISTAVGRLDWMLG